MSYAPEIFQRSLDLEMYPIIPTNASSAAYPSGHALDSYTCGWVLGQKYPELADQLATYCEDLAFTRIQAGVHYRSDADFSKIIFDTQNVFKQHLQHASVYCRRQRNVCLDARAQA